MSLRLHRAEDVRAHAQRLAETGGPSDELLHVAADDPVAATTAWASFVPFLAHPVLAGTARAGMDVLEGTSDDERRPPGQ